jgi:hypothetical protein
VIAIETEPFTDALFAEILPLGKKCWKESTVAKGETCAFYGERDFDIEPDVTEYQRLADLGALLIVVMRDAGVACGYVSGFTYRALHHHKIKGCIGDTCYVEPKYRSYAGVLVDKFVKEMERREVQIIGWPTTPEGYMHSLLLARGFVGDDIVMEKRLCA